MGSLDQIVSIIGQRQGSVQHLLWTSMERQTLTPTFYAFFLNKISQGWIVSVGWHMVKVVGVTYADSGLIGGELAEDVVGVGWADPHLREGREFLGNLIQQSPHLRQTRTSCQCVQVSTESR